MTARLSDSVPPPVKMISCDFAPSRRGEPVARVVDRRPRLAARGVDARRIAEMPLQKRPHRLERLGRERRGGVVVEVDHITQSATHSSGRFVFVEDAQLILLVEDQRARRDAVREEDVGADGASLRRSRCRRR